MGGLSHLKGIMGFQESQDLLGPGSHIGPSQGHQGLDETWLKQEITGQSSAAAAQSPQSFKHPHDGLRQRMDMGLGQFIQ
jgi:hypothetical protein